MTDKEKSVIIATGITLTVGIIGIVLFALSPLLHAIVAGPGMLVHSYVGRSIDSRCLTWLSGSIPQFIIIYFISLSAYSRPPLWQLWIGLLGFAWLVTGIIGYQIYISTISSP